MNCFNHPDQPRAAFCQQCGKPICQTCARSVGAAIFCEPCLQARLSQSPSAAGYTTPPAAAGYTAPPAANQTPITQPPLPDGTPSPFLAGLLGFIPGVGAMYNGQFVKAMIHLLVFACLVAITDHLHFAGWLIAGWIFYQVFDAIYTARARAFGDPLPDPFGFNSFEGQIGMHGRVNSPAAPPVPPSPAAPSAPPPPPGMPFAEIPPRSSAPMGAIVLIALGVLFLANSLNIFDIRGTHLLLPFFLIVLGVWIYFRKACCSGLRYDGSGYDRAYAIRRIFWPAMIILTGLLWLLDEIHVMRWNKSWGLYLLVAGVLMLAQRFFSAQEAAQSYPAAPPPTATAPPATPAAEAPAAPAAEPEAEQEPEPPLSHRNPHEEE